MAHELLRLLLDREGQPTSVRDTCAYAIARIGSCSDVEKLATCLDDPETTVRNCVAAALASVGGPVARRALEDALSNETDARLRFELLRACGLEAQKGKPSQRDQGGKP